MSECGVRAECSTAVSWGAGRPVELLETPARDSVDSWTVRRGPAASFLVKFSFSFSPRWSVTDPIDGLSIKRYAAEGAGPMCMTVTSSVNLN